LELDSAANLRILHTGLSSDISESRAHAALLLSTGGVDRRFERKMRLPFPSMTVLHIGLHKGPKSQTH
jgi:hypothetical protein